MHMWENLLSPFLFYCVFCQTSKYLILTLNNKENLESKNLLPNSEKKGKLHTIKYLHQILKL